MPIEIRELQITAVIQDDSPATAATPSAATVIKPDAIVSACVEQVLEILKQKDDR
jgi:hypothetical protein